MGERLHDFGLRLKALFLRRRLERDMADELAFHQEMLREKLQRQGVAASEVGWMTRQRFGNAARWHERLRELWQFRWLENAMRDAGYAARGLRNAPGFTAVAVVTLALGVGANTTVFSMVNGLLLRPLPVPESDRLALFGIPRGGADRVDYSFPEPLFRGLEQRKENFTHVFAFHDDRLQVRSGNGTEEVPGVYVSGEYFPAMETAPLLGRLLGPEDDVKGGNPAGFGAVISEGFWRGWLGGAPDVIGRKLEIDHTTFTVVGVMPKRFTGAERLSRPDIYVALAMEPLLNGVNSATAGSYHSWWLTVMGRLKAGVNLEQASAQASASTTAILHAMVPDQEWIAEREKEHFRFSVESGSAGFTYTALIFKKPLLVVFGMCGGVLLLACMNLASLLIARSAARQRQLATRLAMGATRQRLVQQLMVESLLIAVVGTAAGLAVAPMVGHGLSLMLLSGQGETHLDTSIDLRVFGFAALVSVVTTLLVGLAPALQATSKSLNEQMKSGQRATGAHERKRILPRVILAMEVGLALVLVVTAGLLASSLVRLYLSGMGFDPKGIENIAINLDQQGLKGDALMQFYRELQEKLRREPGVESVAIGGIVPFSHMTWDENMKGSEKEEVDTYQNRVGPNYFETMRIPLLQGRGFAWSDTEASGLKVVINEKAAKLLFPDRSALGQTVKEMRGKQVFAYQVIGVVGDAKYEELRYPAPPTAYRAMTQDTEQIWRSYKAIVRINGPAEPLAGAARALLQKMAPGAPAPEMTSMAQMVDDSLSAERTMALLAVFFALCALLETAVGLYGTLAYATARRTNEIGLRMALGARRGQVVQLVLWQNAAVAVAGTAAGIIAALLATRALASFVYGVTVRDPWVFAGAIALLALMAVMASLLPALRAARIEPMRAIRCE